MVYYTYFQSVLLPVKPVLIEMNKATVMSMHTVINHDHRPRHLSQITDKK